MSVIREDWFIEEERRIINEYFESDDESPMLDYVLRHASKRFVKEYERMKALDEYYWSQGIICN